MKQKGFTLIELLAVIIILAIIALITTPIILNVVNDARKSAAEDKAWGTIDAVRLAYTQNQSSANPIAISSGGTSVTTFGTYNCLGSGTTAATAACDADFKTIKMSGEKPSKGSVTISDTGVITASGLTFGKYVCSTDTAGSKMTCS